ncbi:probable aquaporin SIP2-1 [Impatiens glandulifera]|uniref:probable aquaporin SIP2-1 n=1 Tax=Impatiens glandulifera TaxID=253017 RepID=UPI001FB09E00|nr:probable aquaporin SIP2-1 [Impatiens glandulifera]
MAGEDGGGGSSVSRAIRLVVSDFILSFMWVWSGVLNRVFVFNVLGLADNFFGESVKCGFTIIVMFFFAYMGKVTGGGTYNPLTLLTGGISGSFLHFLFNFCSRIPAQVLGSVVGVKLIIMTWPGIGHGPRLMIDLHQGALVEGLLTFTIVSISIALSKNIPGSFYTKNWISSTSKIALHLLGSDLTGGCMNPASVTGWAFARGDHTTKEHLLVYWLAPVEATMLAMWISRLLSPLIKEEEKKKKSD